MRRAELADSRSPASIPRLGAAFALGGAGAILGFLLGIPGNGAFVPAIWTAGFAGAVAAPGWRGFAATLGGAAMLSVLLDVADGAYGLVVLVVAVVCALTAHGALVASVLLRWRRLGWRQGFRDGWLVAGATIVVATVVIFAWLARELAQNPP